MSECRKKYFYIKQFFFVPVKSSGEEKKKRNIKSSNEFHLNEQSNMMLSTEAKIKRENSSNFRATSAAIMIPRSKTRILRSVEHRLFRIIAL